MTIHIQNGGQWVADTGTRWHYESFTGAFVRKVRIGGLEESSSPKVRLRAKNYAAYFIERALDCKFEPHVLFKDKDGTDVVEASYLTPGDPYTEGHGVFFAAPVLEQGLLRINELDVKFIAPDMLKDYRYCETAAKRDRAGMWSDLDGRVAITVTSGSTFNVWNPNSNETTKMRLFGLAESSNPQIRKVAFEASRAYFDETPFGYLRFHVEETDASWTQAVTVSTTSGGGVEDLSSVLLKKGLLKVGPERWTNQRWKVGNYILEQYQAFLNQVGMWAR